jgi:HD-GYP domain-containing protein (c-di-GMP phosphodiesterase class II)
MSKIRLQVTQIRVGTPLPFDTYDDTGKLLLRKGFRIESQDQLLRLLERGLYSDLAVQERPQGVDRGERLVSTSVLPKVHRVSVFELIADIGQQLEQLLIEPDAAGFAGRVGALAAQLQRAYRLDGDAALASIQIYQGGRYAVRRMVQGAILIELLLTASGQGPEQRQRVMCAALTMNIAMLDLQDQLFTQAHPPSPEQFEEVKRHPAKGVEMLRALGVADELWLTTVAQHHETIDGKGYPLGLHGDQISREGQILSLADRYGAMATGRGYRSALLPNVVLKQIFMDKDKGVDAQLAGLLVKAVGVYPPGSLVELANGDTAVVVKRTQNASQPVARCVRTYKKEILASPRKRLTSEPPYAITRLLPMSGLGFELNPELLWDEGFELDQS